MKTEEIRIGNRIVSLAVEDIRKDELIDKDDLLTLFKILDALEKLERTINDLLIEIQSLSNISKYAIELMETPLRREPIILTKEEKEKILNELKETVKEINLRVREKDDGFEFLMSRVRRAVLDLQLMFLN